MEISKLVNLSDAELKLQVQQSAEQLFRLRFQKSLGNHEGLKKLRELKQDIARIKTIARQRQLGLAQVGAAPAVVAEAPAPKKTTAKKAKKD
jgi:large subunit ribosomal protein L29